MGLFIKWICLLISFGEKKIEIFIDLTKIKINAEIAFEIFFLAPTRLQRPPRHRCFVFLWLPFYKPELKGHTYLKTLQVLIRMSIPHSSRVTVNYANVSVES